MIAGIKTVLQAGIEENDAIIRERSMEIDPRTENKEMREIISFLKRTMRKTGLVSLSAPGIGYAKRIFCIDFKDKDIKTFINPVILNAEGLQMSKEICTSLPGKTFIRPRNAKVSVMYMTPLGKTESREFLGLAAFVFQHEMDHLDGLLLDEISLEIDDDFEKAPEEERFEVINAYLDSLDIATNNLNNLIENDPELKKKSDAVKFMASVYSGETTLEPDSELEPENIDV